MFDGVLCFVTNQTFKRARFRAKTTLFNTKSLASTFSWQQNEVLRRLTKN